MANNFMLITPFNLVKVALSHCYTLNEAVGRINCHQRCSPMFGGGRATQKQVPPILETMPQRIDRVVGRRHADKPVNGR
jgi:hypothetical protein